MEHLPLEIPRRVQDIYRLWDYNALTFAEIGEIYGLPWGEISKLLRRYYPDVDFKGIGMMRSQEARGCLTAEVKLGLVRSCKCGCEGTLPQFVQRDGKIVRSKRLYIKGHRKRKR